LCLQSISFQSKISPKYFLFSDLFTCKENTAPAKGNISGVQVCTRLEKEGEELIPPYHIYIKMTYHLSQEARAGLSEFKILKEFGNKLFDKK